MFLEVRKLVYYIRDILRAMLKAAEFESVIPDLMSDVFVSSARPKITTMGLLIYSQIDVSDTF